MARGPNNKTYKSRIKAEVRDVQKQNSARFNDNPLSEWEARVERLAKLSSQLDFGEMEVDGGLNEPESGNQRPKRSNRNPLPVYEAHLLDEPSDSEAGSDDEEEEPVTGRRRRAQVKLKTTKFDSDSESEFELDEKEEEEEEEGEEKVEDSEVEDQSDEYEQESASSKKTSNKKRQHSTRRVSVKREKKRKRTGEEDSDGEGDSEGEGSDEGDRSNDYPYFRGEDWIQHTIDAADNDKDRQEIIDYYRRLFKENVEFQETEAMQEQETDKFKQRKNDMVKIVGKKIAKGLGYSEPAGSSQRPSRSGWNYGVSAGPMGSPNSGKTMAMKSLLQPGFGTQVGLLRINYEKLELIPSIRTQAFEWNLHTHVAVNGSEVFAGHLPTLPIGSLTADLAQEVAKKVSRPTNQAEILSSIVPKKGSTVHLLMNGGTQSKEYERALKKVSSYARSQGRKIQHKVNVVTISVPDYISKKKTIKGGILRQEVHWFRDSDSKLLVSQAVLIKHLSFFLLPTGDIKGGAIADKLHAFKADLDLARATALASSPPSPSSLSSSSSKSKRSSTHSSGNSLAVSPPPKTIEEFNSLSRSSNVCAMPLSPDSLLSSYIPFTISSRLLTITTGRGGGGPRPKGPNGEDLMSIKGLATRAKNAEEKGGETGYKLSGEVTKKRDAKRRKKGLLTRNQQTAITQRKNAEIEMEETGADQWTRTGDTQHENYRILQESKRNGDLSADIKVFKKYKSVGEWWDAMGGQRQCKVVYSRVGGYPRGSPLSKQQICDWFVKERFFKK
ncbi:hypothetical protein JCM5353_008764 [Sporobolomyces roseus]